LSNEYLISYLARSVLFITITIAVTSTLEPKHLLQSRKMSMLSPSLLNSAQ